MGATDTIVPIVLIFIAVVFIWSKFGEPIGRFVEWLKSKMTGGGVRDRFQPTRMAKELVYE